MDAQPEPRPEPAQPASQALLPEAERAELEALRERLRVRTSVTWFARGGVLALVGILLFGLSTRLLVDSRLGPAWAAGLGVVAAVALGGLGVALACLRRGQARREGEHADFRRFLELRTRAGID